MNLSATDIALASLALKGSLLLLLSFAAAAALRRTSANTRHLLWATTFAGLLLLPAAGLFLPSLLVPLPPILTAGPSVQLTAMANEPVLLTDSSSDPARFREGPVDEGTPLSPGQEKTTTEDPRALSLLRKLKITYGAGSLLILLWLGVGILRAWQLTRSARPLEDDPRWRPLLAQLPGGLGRARLLASPALRVPMTWGFFRPSILLPAEAGSWPREERRQALIHELAHVQRHDWLTQIFSRLVCALHWFQPLAWLAARRLSLEAERAADDKVILAGAEATAYAEQLVSLVTRLRRASSPETALTLSTVLMARRSQLPVRIHAILDPNRRRYPMTLTFKILAVPLLLIPSLIVASAEFSPGDANPLFEAIERSDASAIQQLLEAGQDVNLAVPGAGTPLMVAAKNGDLELVELLLAKGADVNLAETARPRREDRQRTPLTAAARGGHLEVVQSLLDAGATVDRAPQGDATALIAAAENGHGAVVRLLIDRGADVNRTISGDGSPLIAATRSGDLDTVNLLLDAGADPDVAVDGDENPLYHAAGASDAEMVRALVDAGADVNLEIPGDGNALIEAARRGDRKTSEILLEAGARGDRGVQGNGSPLIEAAGNGDLALVQLFLDEGADVNHGVLGDGSPLIVAARNGQTETVQLLLEAGAEIDRVVEGDENALIQASGSGQLQVVQVLVGAGANVNARVIANGNELRTPLNQARRGGHSRVVAFLQGSGARE